MARGWRERLLKKLLALRTRGFGRTRRAGRGGCWCRLLRVDVDNGAGGEAVGGVEGGGLDFELFDDAWRGT
jgi:hypothetical protein